MNTERDAFGMNAADIEATNATTLKKLAAGSADPLVDRYFGFYTADIFDCPPFVMFTANDCPRARDILYNRFFEQMSMRIWCRLAPRATAILDIGAHVGVYSLAAAALRPDLLIHAFEPNPYAFARLRMHKTINGFSNIVENRMALADKDEISLLSWFIKPGLPIASGAGLGAGKPDGSETTIVEARRLDGLPVATQIGNRGLVKIDVEGAEAWTIMGMANMLAAAKPDIILETFSPAACDAISALLLPLDYQTYLIRERAADLILQDRLYPRSPKGDDANFNQFLTTRPFSEINILLS